MTTDYAQQKMAERGMNSGGASTSRKLSVRDMVDESRSRSRRESQSVKASTIQNPIAQIIESDAAPEVQANQIAELLSNEQAQENLEHLNSYKNLLQEQRKEDSRAVIDATDSEVFSDLKKTLNEMNQGVLDIRDQLEPFTRVVQALHTLNRNGKTSSVVQEIIVDRRAAEERKRQVMLIQDSISRLNENIENESDNKAFLFFGPIKGSSKAKIERFQSEIEKQKLKIEEIQSIEGPSTEFDDFIEEKEALAELLNIESEETQRKQKQLIETARRFIDNSDERMRAVLDKFDSMSGQIETLETNNYDHNHKYAIISDAQIKAISKNMEMVSLMKDIDENASQVQKLKAEKKLRDRQNLVEILNKSNNDTSKVSLELGRERIEIQTLKQSNSQQFEKAQMIQSSGIAGVASGLSITLQAVNRAANGESSEAALMAINEVRATSKDILENEMISNAQLGQEEAARIQEALVEIEQIGEVFAASTEMTRESLREVQLGVDEVQDRIQKMKQLSEESQDVTVDVISNHKAG